MVFMFGVITLLLLLDWPPSHEEDVPLPPPLPKKCVPFTSTPAAAAFTAAVAAAFRADVAVAAFAVAVPAVFVDLPKFISIRMK